MIAMFQYYYKEQNEMSLSVSVSIYLSISFPKGNIQVEILFEHFIFQCMFLGKGEF